MVERVRSGRDVLHQRRIGHRPGHRAAVIVAVEVGGRSVRVAPVRRFEPHDAAGRCRNADRSADVGAGGERRRAGSHPRRRSRPRNRRGRSRDCADCASHPRASRCTRPKGRTPAWSCGRGRWRRRRAALDHRGRSSRRRCVSNTSEPWVVRLPLRRWASFTASGSPSSGRGASPLPIQRVSATRAAASAFLVVGVGEGVDARVHRFGAGDHRRHQFDGRQCSCTEGYQGFDGGDVGEIGRAHAQGLTLYPPTAPDTGAGLTPVLKIAGVF